MPALTSPDLALVRGEGHRSQFYLKAIVPATVFAARVNSSSLIKGGVTIPFDTVTTGAYTDIVGGMTLLVGSAAGLSDIGYGRVRVKSATSSVLHLAVNVIPWADNLYLTVLQEFLEWPKEVRIEAGVVYVDGNDAYTNLTQDTKWGPVVIMGSSGAFLFDGVSTSVTFDLRPSYALATGATIASYAINYGDGSTSTTASTTHSYTAEGTYIVTATVTDSLGNSATSRRVIVITTPDNAFTDFEPGTLECQIDGGAKMSFVVHGDCTLADFPRGCQIVLFADEWFGTTQGSIGYEAYRSNVKFFGTLDEGSIQLNPQTSQVTFSASSIDGMMGRNAPFPVFVQDAASATHWEQAETLTMRRALYYLLKFHSTILEVADVFIQADNTELAFADFAGDSVWSQLVGFARTRRFMRCGVTPRGSLYIRTDPQIVATASRSGIAQAIQLTAADWINQVTIAERDWPATSFLQLSGVTYDGDPSHDVQPIFAKAPGYPNHTGGALPYGTPDDTPYFQFVDQAEASAWAGMRIAQLNANTGEIVIPLDGNWANVFDPAWQEWIKAPSAGFPTVRGAQLANARLIPRRMSVQYSAQNGTTEVTLTCEAETSGAPGETGDAPPTPPGEPCPAGTVRDSDGNCVPPTAPPCPPGQFRDNNGDCVLQPPVTNVWRKHVFAASALHVWESNDFSGPGGAMPTWTDITGALAPSIAISVGIQELLYDAADQTLVALVGVNGGEIWKRVGSGAWTLLGHGYGMTFCIGGVCESGTCACPCGEFFAYSICGIYFDINHGADYIALIANRADGGTHTFAQGGFAVGGFHLNGTAAPGLSAYVARSIAVDCGTCGCTITDAPGWSVNQTIVSWPFLASAFKNGVAFPGTAYLPLYEGGSFSGHDLRRTTTGINSAGGWRQVTVAGDPFDWESVRLTIDPGDPETVYAYSAGVGLNISTNGGANFTNLLSGGSHALPGALSVLLDWTGRAQTIRYFSVTGAPYPQLNVSTDGGATWTSQVGTTLPGGPTVVPGPQLSIVYDSPTFLYFYNGILSSNNTHHQVQVSDDEGATWEGKAGAHVDTGANSIPYSEGIIRLIQDYAQGGL